MSEGDGMAKVTEADLRRAGDVCMDMPGVDFDDDGESWREKVRYVAKALVEEREKARAPFAALAQELATVATYHHATVAGDAYADSADRIIAILEGTYR